ncbi:Sec-independent protein translocase subunit TatA [Streptomyces tsukubensis]|uniref:Sec-independent protein translocase protein TatA n=1 Tax=Streptomyces tsukubensis TaxID=83656 RepID=A0A1V4A693_9ACTN|nr:Sec-independent protein translocase subunit TatA [Streptomyces tsukubensis]OON77278.1 hypothetical protein B1H18_18675 [Streptomyces tsukubensis]QFR92353.1 twin-arginine translocase TatA/TatE family subunit [Streptomyces tsukubensis]
MFRNALEPWHLLVLIVVVALVFGSKKLPDTARALGKSMRILKSETAAMKAQDPAAAPVAEEPSRTVSTAPGAPTQAAREEGAR